MEQQTDPTRIWWDRGRSIGASYYQQKAELPDLKAVCPECAEVNAQVLQDVTSRVERAFAAFFRRLKNGETPDYPRFQGWGRYQCFTYPQYGAHGGVVLDGGALSLSKIGRVGIRVHRPLQGTPKTVTISREADGWYASISCAEVPTRVLPLTGNETGIDVGLKVFMVTVDGKSIENPRHYRTAEKQRKKAQRRVWRRTQGSRRRQKVVALLKRQHQNVQRQRRGLHHETALALLRTYDSIFLDDLQVRTMVQNRHLAKSSGDAGWAPFRTILTSQGCVGRASGDRGCCTRHQPGL